MLLNLEALGMVGFFLGPSGRWARQVERSELLGEVAGLQSHPGGERLGEWCQVPDIGLHVPLGLTLPAVSASLVGMG